MTARTTGGRPPRCWWVALAAAGLAAAPAAAADLAGAKAFVAGLYAHYPTKAAADAFDPTGASAAQVFDRSTTGLLREDARLADGEEGAIDADPLCQCQDDSGLKVAGIVVTPAGADRALAVVRLRFGASRRSDATRVSLDLALEQGAWRVHDIHGPDTASLRRALIDGDRQIRRDEGK